LTVLVERFAAWRGELVALRRDLHAHPELAFEESRTARRVAELLESYGIPVTRNVGGTGVVGTIRRGDGTRSIALRADMDALPIQELNGFEHRSRIAGQMHACGHDGHTVMLLAAARYLGQQGGFDGTVHFIFQPAEETGGGAKAMLDDGLFSRFPAQAVFGLHNHPSLEQGHFASRTGVITAACDTFDLLISGQGGHGAFPHLAVDPIVVGAQIVTALQTIVSRNVDPVQTAVLSVTQFAAGGNYNVIPTEARLKGCVRTFEADVQKIVEARLLALSTGIAHAYDASVDLTYRRVFPAVVNTEAQTAVAVDAAVGLVGSDKVAAAIEPLPASEDFAFLLGERPGCYMLLGTGREGSARMVHNPEYDFNDGVIEIGAAYWVRLVEKLLPGGRRNP
jgi:hippurate hydrolase